MDVIRSAVALLFLFFHWGLWAQQKNTGRIFHYSVMDAMRNAVYHGERSVGDLRREGDFGLGTFNGLDGELILLDGIFYRVAPDGTVAPAPDAAKIPFAALTFWGGGQNIKLVTDGSFDNLLYKLREALPSKNVFYAIRIPCTFSEITVGGAEKVDEGDTTGLAVLMKNRPLYKAKNVAGTIVGFYNPPYLGGVDLSPFHFHFLSADRRFGGHLVSGRLAAAGVEAWVEPKNSYEIQLPDNDGFRKNWRTQNGAQKNY